jgi:segregation and condensation protein B
MNLEQKIEAVLFWKAEPVTVKKLASLLNDTEENIKNSVNKLKEDLKNRGICVMEKNDEIVLATNPEISGFLSELTKDEFNRDIGKAGMETLSIVLYQGPVSRKEIDYIRGVNSGFVLRNLMVRGLVEKVEDSNDHRTFLYKPTFELLSFMGVSKVEALPDYDLIRNDIEAFKGTSVKVDEESKKNLEDIEKEING